MGKSEFHDTLRALRCEYITNVFIDNYGIDDDILVASEQDTAFQSIKILKISNWFVQGLNQTARVIIPFTEAMFVRLLKNEMLKEFTVEFMTTSEVLNSGINSMVTATANSITQWQKWGWNINNPSIKNLTIYANDIRAYCSDIGLNDGVNILIRGLMYKLSGKMETIRWMVLTPNSSDNHSINSKDSFMYNIVYILIVFKIIMKYQYWILIQCCILCLLH